MTVKGWCCLDLSVSYTHYAAIKWYRNLQANGMNASLLNLMSYIVILKM